MPVLFMVFSVIIMLGLVERIITVGSVEHGSCISPEINHTVLDGQCNRSHVCAVPLNVTIEMQVFNHSSIVVIKHEFLSSSLLYQDVAEVLCKYKESDILEEEDVNIICQKLGMSCVIDKNGRSEYCDDRDYILANISDSCNLSRGCRKHVNPIKVELVKLKPNSSNASKSVLDKVGFSMQYSGTFYSLSTLFCRLYQDKIKDYKTTNSSPSAEDESVDDRNAIIVGVVFGCVVLIGVVVVIVCVCKRKKRGDGRGNHEPLDLSNDTL